jgi:hypothetical protein
MRPPPQVQIEMWDEASLGSDGLIGRCSLPLPLVELMGMPPGTHIQHVADLRVPQSIKPCGRLVFTIAFEPTPATVRAHYSQRSTIPGCILSQLPTCSRMPCPPPHPASI